MPIELIGFRQRLYGLLLGCGHQQNVGAAAMEIYQLRSDGIAQFETLRGDHHLVRPPAQPGPDAVLFNNPPQPLAERNQGMPPAKRQKQSFRASWQPSGDARASYRQSHEMNGSSEPPGRWSRGGLLHEDQ
jgi:hypothetical protein